LPLSLWFPHQNPIYTSTLLRTCYMPRPPHSQFENMLNDTWVRFKN
jgi:hypothetical protein